MINIILESPKAITLTYGVLNVEKTVIGFGLISLVDNAENEVSSVVNLNFQGGGSTVKKLILWKDAEYDSIGDWTQAQAEARIIEVL